MSTRRNRNVDAFNSEAAVLERLYPLGDPAYAAEMRTFLAHLELPSTESGAIVELGCALGNLTRLLLESFLQAAVIGIDGAPALVEIAKRRSGDNPRVRFIVSTFEDVDWAGLPPECAAVVAVHSLEHVEPSHRQRIFESVHRVLRCGGIFLDREWARDITPSGVDPRDRSRPEHQPEFIRRAFAEGRITEEEHWRLWDKLAQPATHHFMDLDQQLAAFRRAGFSECAGEWLNEAITLVHGRR
jgi:SAM-dependent methyltransferase